jgi:hypothetical protein
MYPGAELNFQDMLCYTEYSACWTVVTHVSSVSFQHVGSSTDADRRHHSGNIY